MASPGARLTHDGVDTFERSWSRRWDTVTDQLDEACQPAVGLARPGPWVR